MAKYQSLLSLFFIVLVATTLGVPMAEAKLCERRSKTWSGICTNTGNCNRQCKTLEKAKHGACHFQFPGFACFCYFNC
ncbi:defensin-like protein 1 [Magnolia sinica]|uniref:defensin-like protein 1 n=1 Tax=Magnolia sinica TaxID=86752 RepID=UPI002658DA0A|nr:defensin-like protein 1 [Magnolia sinica]